MNGVIHPLGFDLQALHGLAHFFHFGVMRMLQGVQALHLGDHNGVLLFCLLAHGYGKILGGDMIGEIALAIEMGADAVDIGKTIHPHPTLGESIGMAAEVAHGSCTDVPPARK